MAGLGHAREVFERVKRSLAGIAQHMAALAPIEGNADQPVNGRADLAHRLELLIDDIGRHASALEQVPVEPAEIAFNPLGFLDGFDAIDRGRLALVEQPCRFCLPDLLQLAHEVVAQGRKVRRGSRCHATCDPFAIDDDDGPAALAEFVGGRDAGNAGADHCNIAIRVAI